MTDNLTIKNKLIGQIVNRLRQFGFIHVDEFNITTDEVYSLYFLKILNEMLGENIETDSVIHQLQEAVNVHNKTKLNKENKINNLERNNE